MSDRRSASRFGRLAALAEIFLVLALGNIAGVAIYDAILAASATPPQPGSVAEALYSGLRILLRIGLVAAFGLALLWVRRGVTPRDAGLTRAGKPFSHLVGIGVLLGAFSSFLIGLVFAVHAVVPLGEELAAWQDFREASVDVALVVELLATSIVIPPLVEEIMARGYMRLRLVESYGRIGGVVLTGLVFALAHGKFIAADPLLAIFMVVMIVSSIAWAYIAQVTGSLIPPMIAHAIANTFATVVLLHVWIPFAAVTALVLWQRRPIFAALRRFADDWRADRERPGAWMGGLVLVLTIAALTIAIPLLGRTTTLVALGSAALAVTAANLVLERQS